MATGTIRFFHHGRGFGFIAPTDGGRDVFVHATAVESAGISALTNGQKISYEAKTDERSGRSSAFNLRTA